MKSNQAGLAVGQTVFASSQVDGGATNDGNIVWEAWYRYQVSDHISITPGAFYLSRPLGQQTAQGKSFSQLGTVLKTTITFQKAQDQSIKTANHNAEAEKKCGFEAAFLSAEISNTAQLNPTIRCESPDNTSKPHETRFGFC